MEIVALILPYPILAWLLYLSYSQSSILSRYRLRERVLLERLGRWKREQADARLRYERRLLGIVRKREKQIVSSVDEVATGLGELYSRLGGRQ